MCISNYLNRKMQNANYMCILRSSTITKVNEVTSKRKDLSTFKTASHIERSNTLKVQILMQEQRGHKHIGLSFIILHFRPVQGFKKISEYAINVSNEEYWVQLSEPKPSNLVSVLTLVHVSRTKSRGSAMLYPQDQR